jgi:Methane oxygenase PmoA
MLRLLNALILTMIFSITLSAAEFEVTKQADQVEVKYDGKLVTNYIFKSGTKPILWPIIGPTGEEMTRAYPMRDGVAGEKKDHIHHRSLWFTYGDVNGVSFWHEEGKEKPGLIVHKELVTSTGGETAKLVTRNDWVTPHGKKLCEDERTIVIGKQPKQLVIDFDILLKATDGDVTFGDTKEGAFGVRVPSSMDVTAKQGGKIINSEGQADEAAWGQAAKWVDYSGPVNKQTCGIAILNHPSSYRFPSRWHVRTYGLFAANPFGEKDFPGGNKEQGTHLLPAGKTLSLKYRVIFHADDAAAANIAQAYSEYAATK